MIPCRNTQYVIACLYSWSKEFPADQMHIVQFNCGHWDVAHWNGYEESLTSSDEYGRNLWMIIQLLRKLFPKAKLIFATTTVMNPDGSIGRNPRYNEEIERYNRIAVEVAEAEDVMINDLNAVTAAYSSDMCKDYCHLTEAAFDKLGSEVAEFIRRMICEAEKMDAKNIDQNVAVNEHMEAAEWHDVRKAPISIHGLYEPETETFFHRIPLDIAVRATYRAVSRASHLSLVSTS